MKKEITQKLVFNGATFKKRADFKNLVFEQDTDFSNARFEESVDFSDSCFKRIANFKDAKIGTLISNNDQNQKSSIKFSRCVFEGNVDFSSVRFLQDAYFHRAIFKKDIQFYRSYFDKVANFYFATFREVPNFSMCVFNNPKFANFVGMTLPFDSIEKLKEYIDRKATDEAKEEINEDNPKQGRTKTYLLTQHSLNIRDSFRVVKETLIIQNNSLDSQVWHKMELYAKELEYLYRTDIKSLANEIRKLEEEEKNQKDGTNSNPRQDSKEALELNRKNRIKNTADKWQLWFYRLTSEHHTDLLKIVNNLAILVSLFALFAWGLKELSLIEDYSNRVGEMLYGETIEQITGFVPVRIMLDLTKVALDFCQMILAFDPLISIALYFISLNLVLVLLALSIFAIGLILCCVIWICLQKQKLFRIFIKIAIRMIKILICMIFFLVLVLGYQTSFIFFTSLLFVTIFIYFLSLKSFVRYFIVSLAYVGFFYTLCNQPSFINPFIGGLFNGGDKELPVIFQNPIFITLAIVYSFLMLLLLFSLQKTARKNSIIPT